MISMKGKGRDKEDERKANWKREMNISFPVSPWNRFTHPSQKWFLLSQALKQEAIEINLSEMKLIIKILNDTFKSMIKNEMEKGNL